MSQKLIYVENDYDGRYGEFWGRLGEVVTNRQSFMRSPGEFDLVCFTGGEDVSPELYGHQNLRSYCSKRRDQQENLIFELAAKEGISMSGICRGSQFLNVKCGGTMVQHLRRDHGGSPHDCGTYDEELFSVTSSHHQMSVPGPGGQVLAWASIRLHEKDCIYDGELPRIAYDEPELGSPLIRVTEAIYYPEMRVFAVQHHPEWQRPDEEAPQWTLRMTRQFCFGEENLTLEM